MIVCMKAWGSENYKISKSFSDWWTDLSLHTCRHFVHSYRMQSCPAWHGFLQLLEAGTYLCAHSSLTRGRVLYVLVGSIIAYIGSSLSCSIYQVAVPPVVSVCASYRLFPLTRSTPSVTHAITHMLVTTKIVSDLLASYEAATYQPVRME